MEGSKTKVDNCVEHSTTWPYISYDRQQGWECPRCGRINAPWLPNCDCSRGYTTITWTSDHIPDWKNSDWWKPVTGDDSIMNNKTTYTYTTSNRS